MATTLYFTDTLSALSISGYVVRTLSFERGSGVVTKTQDTSAVDAYVYDTGTTPLAFAVRVEGLTTTAAAYTHNEWGYESSAYANFTNCWGTLYSYTDAGTLVTDICYNTSGDTAEYGTSPAVRTNSTTTHNSRGVDTGQWLVYIPRHHEIADTGLWGYTLGFSYNGTGAAADGDAYIVCPDTIVAYVDPPAWTTPADTDAMDASPELKFTIPYSAATQHFWLQLDTAASFDTGALRTCRSDTGDPGWTYYNGADWVAVPAKGVATAYIGNEARYIPPTPLATGTWYRRVKAGS